MKNDFNRKTRVLRVRDLVKIYGDRRVVDGVSLQVRSGEVVGLLGPNGAGKTTTFYMIIGVVRPNAGAIDLDGQDITRMPMYKRARAGLGYLSQESSIFRKLTVFQNIMAVLEMRGVPKDEAIQRTEEALAMLRVAHLRDQRADRLSGGERRRVEIARALVLRPAFLLLDEPFTGIDPKTREEIQDIIRQLANLGIGILITDHNVRETLEITDRAYIIYEGRILIEGTSKELVENPEARQIYLGERFRL